MKTALSDEAYAEIAANLGGVATEETLEDIGLVLRGPGVSIHEVGPEERQRILHNGMFTYVCHSLTPQMHGGEWWSTPDGKSVLLSRRRIEAILLGDDDGMPKDTSHLVFKEWVRCEPKPKKPKKGDPEPEPYDPLYCEQSHLEHVQVNGFWGHLIIDSENPLPGIESLKGFQYVTYTVEDEMTENLTWPDGSPRVRIEADDPDPEDPRKPLDVAGPVKDLTDGVERVSGFLEALHDPSLGHQAIAEMFPFTTESSVRRWRKANGVVIS